MSEIKRHRNKTKGQDEASAFSVLTEHDSASGRRSRNKGMSLEERGQWQVYRDAISNDYSSMKIVVEWIMQREATIPRPGLGIKFLFANDKPKRVDDALVILGIATEVPNRPAPKVGRYLQLEPWFVDYAQDRPQARTLSADAQKQVAACTRSLFPDPSDWESGS